MSDKQLMDDLFLHSNKMIELAKQMHDSCLRKRNKVKTNYRHALSAFFSRSLEIFKSIIILVDKDRITDAGVLLRSLTNLLINLGYIDRNKEERATLMLYDLATQHRILYEKGKPFFDSWGKSQEVNRYIQHYKNEEMQLKQIIQSKYPNAKPWHKVKIIERAAAHTDLQLIYSTIYADLSRFEHHDFSALRTYVNPNTSDPILVSGPQRHSPLLNPENILMSAILMLGIILEFFNAEFQLNLINRIKELTQEFTQKIGLAL